MKKITLLLVAVMAAITAFAKGEITSLPEGGTTVKYLRQSRSYFFYQGGPMAQDDKSSVGELTYYDNGDVYMYEPFASYPTGAYIKGYKEGNKIIFPLNVPIVEVEDDYTWDVVQLYACRMVYRSEFKSMKPADDQNLVFNILDNGVIQMEGYKPSTLDDVVMLGLSNAAGIWYWAGEQNLEFYPAPDVEVTTIPAGLKKEAWSLVSRYESYSVNVAIDEAKSEMYIEGIFPGVPQSAIKGLITDDQVIFPDEQYLGVYMNHHIYMQAIDYQEIYYAEADYWYAERVRLDEVTFDYDPSRQLLISYNEMLINAGTETLDEVTTIYHPIIKGPNSGMPITQPMTPEWVHYTPYRYFEDDGFYHGTFGFTVPAVDMNYNSLNTDQLFFQIFYDEDTEPYEFRKSMYTAMTVDSMVDVPWGYTDYLGFYQEGRMNQYVFFLTNCDRIGVRSVYYDNGKAYYSDILWSDKSTTPSGISNPAVDSESPIVSVELYDLQGRKVSNPQSGMFIRVAKHADGTVSSTKITK